MSHKLPDTWFGVDQEMILRTKDVQTLAFFTGCSPTLFLPYKVGISYEWLLESGKILDNLIPNNRWNWADKKYDFNPDKPFKYYSKEVDDHVELTRDGVKDIKIRYKQNKNFRTYNKWVDEIAVGDFVQFSGQVDANSWRKIINIDYEDGKVFGLKYSKPYDDIEYCANISSVNSIYTIKDARQQSN